VNVDEARAIAAIAAQDLGTGTEVADPHTMRVALVVLVVALHKAEVAEDAALAALIELGWGPNPTGDPE
jgi:hypothetical protein